MKYQNKTALITGASSGLGYQFAKSFAALGADLVLVARRLDRLTSLANEIESVFQSTVTVIQLDLVAPNAVDELVSKLKEFGLQINILVNNAGFGTSGYFANEDLMIANREIDLNIKSLVSLTRLFLPQMISNSNGIVINVASTAAFQPVPTMAIYGATKAFVLSFTEALWAETIGTGVKVIALCPGATDTEFFDVAKSKGTGAKREAPKSVVDLVLKELEKNNTKPSIVSGLRNRIISFLPRIFSRQTMSKLSLKTMTSN